VGNLPANSAYESLLFERYPDSADLLPISVAAWIFMHGLVNPELAWRERNDADGW